MNIPSIERLEKVYGESVKSGERLSALAENFQKKYGHDEAEFFSAPGRTEIIGNHTDHNGGKVIAGSIDLDTIGAAYPNNSSVIHITSEGYDKEVVVDIDRLDNVVKGGGTVALLAGMIEGAQKFGFQVRGFDAYVSTNVIAAAGVSSSASFEMLVCTIVNHFFNDGAMSCADYAKIGKYSENVYWNKASGMMDQMACAVGGPVLFDFANGSQPEYRPLTFSFEKKGYRLVIVNTGKGHADLSEEYSGIPNEMKEAAKVLGAELLCETNLEKLLAHANEIENDRVLLRAIHFFEENRRVDEMAEAIEKDDINKVLKLVKESGTSSWELLQNCYSLQNCKEQKITRTLALTELFLQGIGDGVCRVHGGGFAGVIMCLVPLAEADNYVKYIANYVGESNVYPMNIRAVGAVRI
ncbi:MAG: galactokinase [Lachnospiraceae bacterium]|jgi:galactokinase|nr:galactokinase [Lachnospiraceae bacterium]HBV81268.1 galactokinase [Lachnospiraceae bacterium]